MRGQRRERTRRLQLQFLQALILQVLSETADANSGDAPALRPCHSASFHDCRHHTEDRRPMLELCLEGKCRCMSHRGGSPRHALSAMFSPHNRRHEAVPNRGSQKTATPRGLQMVWRPAIRANCDNTLLESLSRLTDHMRARLLIKISNGRC